METLLIQVNRGRSAWIAVLSLAMAALLGWFAWELADPNFSAGGARRAAFLQDLPVWFRSGFMGLCAAFCLYAVAISIRAALRTEPSFSIGPDGVSDLRKMPPRRLGWDEIGEVSADANFLYVKPRGSSGMSFTGGGRISIPLKGITPGRGTVLAALGAGPPAVAR